MGKTITAVVLAGLAQFMLGFLYWGATTLPYGVLGQAKDDVALQTALAQQLPATGSYMVPHPSQTPEILGELLATGPSALIHLTAPPQAGVDPMTLLTGLGHNILVAALLALLLQRSGVSGYGARVAFLALAGITASVLLDLGNVIWWQMALPWALTLMLYNVLAWVVPALVLAKMLPAANQSGA